MCKVATKPIIHQPAKIPPIKGGNTLIYTNVAQAAMAAINYEVMVAWHSMGSPAAKQRFMTDVYPALKIGLGEYIDARAHTNPRSLHHVYEWEMVGDPVGRLWKTKMTRTGSGSMRIQYYFVNSKRVAPINPILKKAGPSGSFVSKSHIFKEKAIVMEGGNPVVITRKSSKFLTIPQGKFDGGRFGKQITFTKGPIIVRNPGGVATKLGFAKAFSMWFRSGMATKYLRTTGAYNRVSARTTRAGKMIPSRIRHVGISGAITVAEIEALALAEVSKL